MSWRLLSSLSVCLCRRWVSFLFFSFVYLSTVLHTQFFSLTHKSTHFCAVIFAGLPIRISVREESCRIACNFDMCLFLIYNCKSNFIIIIIRIRTSQFLSRLRFFFLLLLIIVVQLELFEIRMIYPKGLLACVYARQHSTKTTNFKWLVVQLLSKRNNFMLMTGDNSFVYKFLCANVTIRTGIYYNLLRYAKRQSQIERKREREKGRKTERQGKTKLYSSHQGVSVCVP